MRRLWPWLLCAAVCSCARRARQAGQEPQQTLRDLTLSQSYKSAPLWDLKAEAARLTDEDKRAVLDSPKMDFYKDRKLTTTVTAQTGFVRMDTRDVKLSSSVVVRSLEDSSVLRTSELDYSSARQKFFTDKDVVVVRPGGVLRGRGLEATPDLSEIRVFNQRAEIEGERPPL